MKNKMLIILVAIIVLFASLAIINNMKNKKATEDNPYNKTTLHQETIDQLDDPLYNNIIVPEDLAKEIEAGNPTTVYFFSPTCVYCQQTTPVVVPLTEELDIEMQKMNLLEFGDQKEKYDIEGTPTIIHYDKGEEVARIAGQQEEETYRQFFDEYVLN